MEWRTAAEVIAAKDAIEAAMPGWHQPATYALGELDDAGAIDWRVINHPNRHLLPAAVLGRVLGHRSGNASYSMSDAQLDEAIAMVKPAEACAEFQHPNLWGWEALRSERRAKPEDARRRLVVAFIENFTLPLDEAQSALAKAL